MVIKKSTLKQNKNVLSTQLSNEMVLLDVAQGKYFGLNETGQNIWSNLEEPQTIAELTNKLSQKFQDFNQQQEKETIDFINILIEKKLVESI